VIWQRRAVIRFGLAVMGGPNFQTTTAKRRLSKLANVIGTGRILTRDVCGLIFGQWV